jgi:hypothetical protein
MDKYTPTEEQTAAGITQDDLVWGAAMQRAFERLDRVMNEVNEGTPGNIGRFDALPEAMRLTPAQFKATLQAVFERRVEGEGSNRDVMVATVMFCLGILFEEDRTRAYAEITP